VEVSQIIRIKTFSFIKTFNFILEKIIGVQKPTGKVRKQANVIRPKSKFFSITRTIFSHSRSKQFLEQNTFF